MTVLDNGVRIEGLATLTRKLRKAGAELEELRGVYQPLADRGAVIAARLAPKLTGALSRSVRGHGYASSAVITAGSAEVPYAGAQNYGSPAHGIRATHFMDRSVNIMRPMVVPQVEAGLTAILRRVGLV